MSGKDEKVSIKPDKISVSILCHTGDIIYLNINKTIRFLKLMEMYEDKTGAPLGSFRFLLNGQRIYMVDTPATLNMKDGAKIEAVMLQTGGGPSIQD